MTPQRALLDASIGQRTDDAQPRANLEQPPARSQTAPRRFSYDVAIVGLGYVGLPTALAFHAAGHRVLGIDVDPSRVEDIRSGAADLGHNDLRRLATALSSPTFAMTEAPTRLSDAATVIVCVPTPVTEDRTPDLAAIRGACETVVACAVAGQTLILTSTTYVGSTTDMLGAPLQLRGLVPGRDVFVAFSPERIDPGNDRHAHEDVPRVVGGVTPACTDRAVMALAGYARNLHPVSSAECAEFTKLHENTFRAVNIAYANEMSVAARALNLDMTEVIAAASTKPYGFMPFMPGPGVGGHCIPCDPHYLLWQLRETKHRLPLIEQAMTSIDRRPLYVVERIRDALEATGRSLAGSRVLIVGVAYKPDVQDVRESPALVIIDTLVAAGAQVRYVDAFVPMVTLRNGQVMYAVEDPTTENPDVVLLHTAHTGSTLDWVPQGAQLLNATYRPIESAPRTELI
jgi:nucleotide sugar dehydrogenase